MPQFPFRQQINPEDAPDDQQDWTPPDYAKPKAASADKEWKPPEYAVASKAKAPETKEQKEFREAKSKVTFGGSLAESAKFTADALKDSAAGRFAAGVAAPIKSAYEQVRNIGQTGAEQLKRGDVHGAFETVTSPLMGGINTVNKMLEDVATGKKPITPSQPEARHEAISQVTGMTGLNWDEISNAYKEGNYAKLAGMGLSAAAIGGVAHLLGSGGASEFKYQEPSSNRPVPVRPIGPTRPQSRALPEPSFIPLGPSSLDVAGGGFSRLAPENVAPPVAQTIVKAATQAPSVKKPYVSPFKKPDESKEPIAPEQNIPTEVPFKAPGTEYQPPPAVAKETSDIPIKRDILRDYTGKEFNQQEYDKARELLNMGFSEKNPKPSEWKAPEYAKAKETYDKVPFDVADEKTQNELPGRTDYGSAKLEEIPVKDLIATQDTVTPSVVEEKAGRPQKKLEDLPVGANTRPPADFPTVVKDADGKMYLTGGTHEATAAMKRGDETIQVVSYDTKKSEDAGGRLVKKSEANKFAAEVLPPESKPGMTASEDFFKRDTQRMQDEAFRRSQDPAEQAKVKKTNEDWNRSQRNLSINRIIEENMPKDEESGFPRSYDKLTPEEQQFRDKLFDKIQKSDLTVENPSKANNFKMRLVDKDGNEVKLEDFADDINTTGKPQQITEEPISASNAVADRIEAMNRLEKSHPNPSSLSEDEYDAEVERHLRNIQTEKAISGNTGIVEMHGGPRGGKTNYPPSKGPNGPTLDKLFGALDDARGRMEEQEDINRQERTKRFKNFAAVKEGGASGAAKALSKLRGEYEKVEPGEALGLTPKETDHLFNVIKYHPGITNGEKARGFTALFKIMNGEGTPPRSDLAILNDVFGNNFGDRIIEMHGGLGAVGLKVGKLANTMKTMENMLSLAAPLRHGIGMIARKEFRPAFQDMFKMFANKEFYDASMQAIEEHPKYLAAREDGLFLPKASSDADEEFLDSYIGNFPKWTGVPMAASASKRAYTGFLNKLKFDTYKNMTEDAEKLGYKMTKVVKDEEGNVDVIPGGKESRGIANFINTFTGRGDLGRLNKMTRELNLLLWSPRMMASRLQMFTSPKLYMDLPKEQRIEGLKSLFAIAALGTTIDTAAALAGAKVSNNLLSTDFGKSRFGKDLIDPWGGFQQYVVAAARLLAGKTDSNIPSNRLEIAGRFLANKESPLASFVHTMLTAKKFTGKDRMDYNLNPLTNDPNAPGSFVNEYGQQTSVQRELLSRFAPIFEQDIQNVVQSDPEWADSIGLKAVMGLGSLAGMAQSYPQKNTSRFKFKNQKLR